MDTIETTATEAPETGKAVALQTEAPPPAPMPEPPQPTSLLPAIIGLARDPQVDVAKLDALLKMQAQMEERDAKREAIEAFTKLSADLPRVKKNGTIDLGADNKGKSRGAIAFARWEDMDKIIRPLLTANGFTLSFNAAPRPGDGGGLIVTGELMHRSGHVRTASIPLPLDSGPGRNNLQAMGSTLSYGKRYCAEMLLNIVREGEDDDGKLAGMQFITAEQHAELQKLIEETGTDERRFLDVLQLQHLGEIQQGGFTIARNMLLQKRRKA
jgi:hypothetical protein